MDTNRLPLTLKRRINEQPPSNHLPLTLPRKLGELGDTPSVPEVPDTPNEPPSKKRRMTLVAGKASITGKNVSALARCLTGHHAPKGVAQCASVDTLTAVNVARHERINLIHFYPLDSKLGIKTPRVIPFKSCQFIPAVKALLLAGETHVKNTKPLHYKGCIALIGNIVKAFRTCQNVSYQTPISYAYKWTDPKNPSIPKSACRGIKYPKAVSVPCRHYPIPNKPPLPEQRACRLPPPSNRLPLVLTKKRGNLPSSALPLYLSCWHDDEPNIIPNLRSYIVQNIISATIGGVHVSPLSFNIKSDMDGFCWQGQVEISTIDYHKIAPKLQAVKGNEALISVTINGTTFVILAEDTTKNRQFVNHSYTLSGRSVTAHLSADYAKGVTEMLGSSLYASQIVANSLAYLPFECKFGVMDWLIPSGSFATSDKTPIGVLGEIATACGAFVMSDKSQGKLYIKPRYKTPAWQTPTPNIIVPLDVILSLSEQKRTGTRFNSVVLTGKEEGAIVYREREGRDKEAPSYDNALLTDQACMIPKGIQILSDSGTHISATITMRWADKYGLALANLGDVWQVNDDTAWFAVVVSVAVSVTVRDGVPMVKQTVGLDRYLDV